MLINKFPYFGILDTTNSNITVADMLSRDFSTITTKLSQLQHEILPPPIEFLELEPNNSLKQQVHYLVT